MLSDVFGGWGVGGSSDRHRENNQIQDLVWKRGYISDDGGGGGYGVH